VASKWKLDPVSGRPIPPEDDELMEEEEDEEEEEEDEEEDEDEESLSIPLTITVLVMFGKTYYHSAYPIYSIGFAISNCSMLRLYLA